MFIVYDAEISGEIKKLAGLYTSYKWAKEADIRNINLDEASLAVLEIIEGGNDKKPSFRATANSATIYVDGGSRGNPGPAGVGYYILSPSGEVIARGGEFIGFNTSRIAEYLAVKEGIEQAIEHGISDARFISDSMMVVGQLNGALKVKNLDLKVVYNDIQRLLGKLRAYSFVHVNREDNIHADAEVNKVIDQYMRERKTLRRESDAIVDRL
jgi:ribonuclease HI